MKFKQRKDIASDVKGVGDDLKKHMTGQTHDIKKHMHDTVNAAVKDIAQQFNRSSAPGSASAPGSSASGSASAPGIPIATIVPNLDLDTEMSEDSDSQAEDDKTDDDKTDDDKADDDKADDDKAQTPQRPNGKGKGTCRCSMCEYLKDIADTFDEDLPKHEAELREKCAIIGPAKVPPVTSRELVMICARCRCSGLSKISWAQRATGRAPHACLI